VSKPHRLFFALVPDPGVRREVESVQKSLAVNGRAAKSGQFHATLSFLGMQQAEVIPDILGVASRLSFEPCTLVMDRFGRFKRAGVLWLGASDVPAALRDFQHALVDGLLEAGIGYDRKPWQFHLTLYRKLRMPYPIMAPVEIEWPLTGFSLIESVSVRSGVEYHAIGHWKAGS